MLKNKTFIFSYFILLSGLTFSQENTLKLYEQYKDKFTTTSSGLKYFKITTNNTSKPVEGEKINIETIGYFEDGKILQPLINFDIIYKESKLIEGFKETLDLLFFGEKIIAYIPYKIAYGEKGIANIVPPNSNLIFEVKLLTKDEISKAPLYIPSLDGGIKKLKSLSNDFKYEGESSNGMYNGKGIFTININFNSWAYKYKFTGNFVNGEMEGIGKMEKILLNKVDFNGPSTRDMEYTFEGMFVNSLISGEGKLRTYLGVQGISYNSNEDFPINSKGQYLLSGIFKSKLDFTIPVIINNEYTLEYGLKLGDKEFIPKSLYKVISSEKSNLAKELGWRLDYKFVFVSNLNNDKANYDSYYTQLKNSGEIKELSFFQALGSVLGNGSNNLASKSSNNYEVLEQTNIGRFEFTEENPSEGKLPSIHLSIGCKDYKHHLDVENDGFNVSFSTNGNMKFKTSKDLSAYEWEIRGEQFWERDGAIINISFYSDDNVFTNLKLKFKKGGSYRIEIYPVK